MPGLVGLTTYDRAAVPPGAVFVAADEPLLIFPSADAAERYLEAVDVAAGTYPAAYSPKGEPYRLGIQHGHVVVEAADAPPAPEALEALLRRHLVACGRPRMPDATLADLTLMAWQIEADFWAEHDPFGERFGTRVPLWGCALAVGIVALAFFALR